MNAGVCAGVLSALLCISFVAADPQGSGDAPPASPQNDSPTQLTDTATAAAPTTAPGDTGNSVNDPIQNATNALGEKIVGGGPISDNAYVLGAEAVLTVTVWHEAELSRPVIVRPDSKITLPLVGQITAAGLTLPQLTAVITAGLKK